MSICKERIKLWNWINSRLSKFRSRTPHNFELKCREATKICLNLNSFGMCSVHTVWQIQLSVFFTLTDSFSKNLFPALQCVQWSFPCNVYKYISESKYSGFWSQLRYVPRDGLTHNRVSLRLSGRASESGFRSRTCFFARDSDFLLCFPLMTKLLTSIYT